MIVIYLQLLPVLFVIYTTEYYIDEIFPLFIPSEEEIRVRKYANFFTWEEDRTT